jgi:hypothetical protein
MNARGSNERARGSMKQAQAKLSFPATFDEVK